MNQLLSPLLLSIFISLTAFADGEPVASKSEAEEQKFVSEINAIIASVVTPPFTQEELNEFRIFSGTLKDAQIILLGEAHTDERALLLGMRFLHDMYKPGDVISVEGVESGYPTPAEEIVFKFFVVKIFNQSGKSYDSGDVTVEIQAEYKPMWDKLKHKLHLERLSFFEGICVGWDSIIASQIMPLPLGMVYRNQAMVKVLEKRLKDLDSANRIYVMAGASHLPRRELENWRRIEDARDSDHFYENVQTLKKDAGWFGHQYGVGSTQVIYDFLKNRNYVEMIPKALPVGHRRQGFYSSLFFCFLPSIVDFAVRKVF